ncbi:MAG TPA: hypothetical protein VNI57_06845 [Candidatus Saccharimonadales bacterium]|nr:hypothetical protein [Candidatus Saccharimonadales bacterium]
MRYDRFRRDSLALLVAALVVLGGTGLSRADDQQGSGDDQAKDDQAKIVPADPAGTQPASDTGNSPARLMGDVDRFATYDAFGNRDPRASRWNPYQQNPLKADFPVFGQRGFFELFAISNTNAKSRQDIGQDSANDFEKSNLLLGFEIKRDEDTFQPSSLKFRLLGNFQADHNGLIKDSNQDAGFQEAVVQARLFEIGHNYDLSFFEGGIRPFRSDFNGLILNDAVGVAHIFGTMKRALWKYNVGAATTLKKDPRSNLVTFSSDVPSTQQKIGFFSLVREDIIPGWTAEMSLHYNTDKRAENLNVGYAGVAFSGHIRRWIFQPAFYLASGTDDLNPLSGEKEDVSAWLGLLDLRYPMDFIIWRGAALYASGDGSLHDGKAKGFDSISDSINLFGGPASFFVGEKINVAGRTLVNVNSALPSFRSGGRSNFVNPGVRLLNLGADFVLTPKVAAAVDVSSVSFADTGALFEALDADPNFFPAGTTGIDKSIGTDASVALRWRPLLIDNFVVEVGASGLVPGDGLKALTGKDKTAYAARLNVLLVY